MQPRRLPKPYQAAPTIANSNSRFQQQGGGGGIQGPATNNGGTNNNNQGRRQQQPNQANNNPAPAPSRAAAPTNQGHRHIIPNITRLQQQQQQDGDGGIQGVKNNNNQGRRQQQQQRQANNTNNNNSNNPPASTNAAPPAAATAQDAAPPPADDAAAPSTTTAAKAKATEKPKKDLIECKGCGWFGAPETLPWHLNGYQEFGTVGTEKCPNPNINQFQEVFGFPWGRFPCLFGNGCRVQRRSKAAQNAHHRSHQLEEITKTATLTGYGHPVKIPCTLCSDWRTNPDKWFTSEEEHGKHIKAHHPDLVDKGDLKCPHVDHGCEKGFHTQQHLCEHIRTAHNNVLYKCNFGDDDHECDYELKLDEKKPMGDLNEHILSKHKTYSCFCSGFTDPVKKSSADFIRDHFKKDADAFFKSHRAHLDQVTIALVENDSDARAALYHKKLDEVKLTRAEFVNKKLIHVRAAFDPERIHRVVGEQFVPLIDFAKGLEQMKGKAAKKNGTTLHQPNNNNNNNDGKNDDARVQNNNSNNNNDDDDGGDVRVQDGNDSSSSSNSSSYSSDDESDDGSYFSSSDDDEDVSEDGLRNRGAKKVFFGPRPPTEEEKAFENEEARKIQETIDRIKDGKAPLTEAQQGFMNLWENLDKKNKNNNNKKNKNGKNNNTRNNKFNFRFGFQNFDTMGRSPFLSGTDTDTYDFEGSEFCYDDWMKFLTNPDKKKKNLAFKYLDIKKKINAKKLRMHADNKNILQNDNDYFFPFDFLHPDERRMTPLKQYNFEGNKVLNELLLEKQKDNAKKYIAELEQEALKEFYQYNSSNNNNKNRVNNGNNNNDENSNNNNNTFLIPTSRFPLHAGADELTYTAEAARHTYAVQQNFVRIPVLQESDERLFKGMAKSGIPRPTIQSYSRTRGYNFDVGASPFQQYPFKSLLTLVLESARYIPGATDNIDKELDKDLEIIRRQEEEAHRDAAARARYRRENDDDDFLSYYNITDEEEPKKKHVLPVSKDTGLSLRTPLTGLQLLISANNEERLRRNNECAVLHGEPPNTFQQTDCKVYHNQYKTTLEIEARLDFGRRNNTTTLIHEQLLAKAQNIFIERTLRTHNVPLRNLIRVEEEHEIPVVSVTHGQYITEETEKVCEQLEGPEFRFRRAFNNGDAVIDDAPPGFDFHNPPSTTIKRKGYVVYQSGLHERLATNESFPDRVFNFYEIHPNAEKFNDARFKNLWFFAIKLARYAYPGHVVDYVSKMPLLFTGADPNYLITSLDTELFVQTRLQSLFWAKFDPELRFQVIAGMDRIDCLRPLLSFNTVAQEFIFCIMSAWTRDRLAAFSQNRFSDKELKNVGARYASETHNQRHCFTDFPLDEEMTLRLFLRAQKLDENMWYDLAILVQELLRHFIIDENESYYPYTRILDFGTLGLPELPEKVGGNSSTAPIQLHYHGNDAAISSSSSPLSQFHPLIGEYDYNELLQTDLPYSFPKSGSYLARTNYLNWSPHVKDQTLKPEGEAVFVNTIRNHTEDDVHQDKEEINTKYRNRTGQPKLDLHLSLDTPALAVTNFNNNTSSNVFLASGRTALQKEEDAKNAANNNNNNNNNSNATSSVAAQNELRQYLKRNINNDNNNTSFINEFLENVRRRDNNDHLRNEFSIRPIFDVRSKMCEYNREKFYYQDRRWTNNNSNKNEVDVQSNNNNNINNNDDDANNNNNNNNDTSSDEDNSKRFPLFPFEANSYGEKYIEDITLAADDDQRRYNFKTNINWSLGYDDLEDLRSDRIKGDFPVEYIAAMRYHVRKNTKSHTFENYHSSIPEDESDIPRQHWSPFSRFYHEYVVSPTIAWSTAFASSNSFINYHRQLDGAILQRVMSEFMTFLPVDLHIRFYNILKVRPRCPADVKRFPLLKTRVPVPPLPDITNKNKNNNNSNNSSSSSSSFSDHGPRPMKFIPMTWPRINHRNDNSKPHHGQHIDWQGHGMHVFFYVMQMNMTTSPDLQITSAYLEKYFTLLTRGTLFKLFPDEEKEELYREFEEKKKKEEEAKEKLEKINDKRGDNNKIVLSAAAAQFVAEKFPNNKFPSHFSDFMKKNPEKTVRSSGLFTNEQELATSEVSNIDQFSNFQFETSFNKNPNFDKFGTRRNFAFSIFSPAVQAPTLYSPPSHRIVIRGLVGLNKSRNHTTEILFDDFMACQPEAVQKYYRESTLLVAKHQTIENIDLLQDNNEVGRNQYLTTCSKLKKVLENRLEVDGARYEWCSIGKQVLDEQEKKDDESNDESKK